MKIETKTELPPPMDADRFRRLPLLRRFMPLRWFDTLTRWRIQQRGVKPAKCALIVIVYIAGYNIVVRLWKGDEHPVNLYRLYEWEQQGRLDGEIVRKKRTLERYYRVLAGRDPYVEKP